ncbi:MAG: hypothetical protein WCK09_17410 [Bacteroidota bacterium]
MKLFSYIIKSDLGFSPNPFWGKFTLACCKPAIRRTAKKGDWIVGLRGKMLYKKLKLPKTKDPLDKYAIIYAMKVSEVLTFDKYYRKFPEKRPDFKNAESLYRMGDNIYKPLKTGDYEQLESRHTIKNALKNKDKDLSGKFVLISDEFYYFGSKPIKIPKNLQSLICGRGDKCKFDDKVKKAFVKHISSKKQGVLAKPSLWNENDNSWKQ